jgi:hypothetical protein
MTTTSLHTVETAQPDPEPDADTGTHLLTDAAFEGHLRQVSLALNAARARGDLISVQQETTQTSWTMTFQVARR